MFCLIWRMFPGPNIYYAGPAQPLAEAGEELDGLRSVRGLNVCFKDLREMHGISLCLTHLALVVTRTPTSTRKPSPIGPSGNQCVLPSPTRRIRVKAMLR